VCVCLCVCLWPLDAEKSDRVACVRLSMTTGRREKWPGCVRAFVCDHWTQRKVTGLRACVCLWPLDAEKSDGVTCVRLSVTTERRKKWQEKNKTHDQAQVDDRRMESFQGPETQVLRVCASVKVLKPRSWKPNIEVLKPRYWEPNAATRACRHGRIVSDRHEYPLELLLIQY
jgi:hypothetical protein